MFRYILENVTPFSTKGKPIKPIFSHLSTCSQRPFSAQFYTTTTATEATTTIEKLFRPVAFYSIVSLSSSHVVKLRTQLETQLSQWRVVGRIYLAPTIEQEQTTKNNIGGINCQMAVPMTQLDSVKNYFNHLKPIFGQLNFTEGMQDTTSPNFDKLRVLIKKNLVSIRQDQDIDTQDLINLQPHHLTPQEWHNELKLKKQDVFLLDMRNQFEYQVGHFDHAIKMNVDTFRDGIDLLDELVSKKSKKDDIYMYCTGGIRCSVAGSYLRKKGFENVKMLEGGVTAYGHYIKEKEQEKESLFKGKNFTFDARRGERITNDVLTTCYHCGTNCDYITNCSNTKCHLLFVQCEGCKSKMKHTCSHHCQNVVSGKEQYQLEYDYHRQVAKAFSSS